MNDSVIKAIDHTALISEKTEQFMENSRVWVFDQVYNWCMSQVKDTEKPRQRLFWIQGGGGDGEKCRVCDVDRVQTEEADQGMAFLQVVFNYHPDDWTDTKTGSYTNYFQHTLGTTILANLIQ